MGGKKKKDDANDIRVRFLGNSAVSVTGSSIEVSAKFLQNKYLVECGLSQEGNMKDNYNANLRMITKVDVKNTKDLFILHQHIDHIGAILAIVHKGFSGKIYCTYEASRMLKPLFEDVCFLHTKECKSLSSRSRKKLEYIPLMTEEDIPKTLDMVEIIEMNKKYELEDGKVQFEYLHNNHILGASSLNLWVRKPNNIQRKIWITSDMGSSICKNYYVDDLEISYKNNLTIMESTYNDKESYTKKDRKEEIALIKKKIDEIVIDNKAKILIPVFSMSRLQFMATLLYEIMSKDDKYQDIQVITDTRLGMNITKEYKAILEDKGDTLFQQVLEWGQLKQICDYKETQSCANDSKPKIVLSASGFLANGTHVTEYLKKWIGDENNCIIFCGYCGNESSLGYKIKDESSSLITIDNCRYTKRCQVLGLRTFSSHIQRNELISLAKQLQTERIILQHGNQKGKETLKEDMLDELKSIGKTTNVICSQKDMEIIL